MKRTEKFTRVFLERKDLVMKYIYRRIEGKSRKRKN